MPLLMKVHLLIEQLISSTILYSFYENLDSKCQIFSNPLSKEYIVKFSLLHVCHLCTLLDLLPSD